MSMCVCVCTHVCMCGRLGRAEEEDTEKVSYACLAPQRKGCLSTLQTQ